MFLPFILIGLGISTYIAGKKKYANKLKEYQKINEHNKKIKSDWLIEVNQLHAKWEQANNRWGQCYYCHRDDVVFIPGEYKYKSLDEFDDLLFQGD